MSDSTRGGEDTSPHIPAPHPPPAVPQQSPVKQAEPPGVSHLQGHPGGAEAALGAQASRSQPCLGSDISLDPLLWGFLSLTIGPSD